MIWPLFLSRWKRCPMYIVGEVPTTAWRLYSFMLHRLSGLAIGKEPLDESVPPNQDGLSPFHAVRAPALAELPLQGVLLEAGQLRSLIEVQDRRVLLGQRAERRLNFSNREPDGGTPCRRSL